MCLATAPNMICLPRVYIYMSVCLAPRYLLYQSTVLEELLWHLYSGIVINADCANTNTIYKNDVVRGNAMCQFNMSMTMVSKS